MTVAVLLAGSDTASYTEQPVDQHRRKRTHDSSATDDGTQSQSEKMAAQASDWSVHSAINVPSNTGKTGVDWQKGSSTDEKDKYNRRRWSLGDSSTSLSKGRTPTRSYLTYLLFSVMIGINVYIIARSFTSDSQQKHHTLPQDVAAQDSLVGRRSQAGDAKSYDLEGYYGSRDSPMFCDLCPSGNDFCKSIGHQNLASSVVYEGTNVRLHRFLRKLQNGEPISMGVIGGSVSSGHGLVAKGPTNEREGPLNTHRRVFDYLTSKYPHPGHKFTNGAVAATGSEYFATCFAEHIPEDVDLVTVELAINDVRHVNSQVEYEMLIRGLLDLPNKPAIINMHTLGLMFDPISQGGDQHLGISHFYDIPTVSLRSVIMPLIMDDYKAAERFYVMNHRRTEDQTWDDLIDYRHISIEGHHLLANLTTLFIERQICKMQAMATLAAEGHDPTSHSDEWSSKHKFDTVPKMMVTKKYSKENDVPALHPQCFSTISKLHPLTPVEQFGWEPWAWKDKKYLVAKVPGAKATFAFETKIGILKVFHQKSAKYGLGQADCWVDDDVHNKRRVNSYWTYDFSLVGYTIIATDLAPGPHLLHCEVVVDTSDPGGGHEFRMTSLTAL